MKEFKSKFSLSVKILTIGLTVVMILLCISLLAGGNENGSMLGLILALIILGSLLYFYANSLISILITDQLLTLRKGIGKIDIPLKEIREIKLLKNTALSLTTGSKGYFGFIGNTMDNTISMVKDRSKMLRIKTSRKQYTLSCENPEKLITGVEIALEN